MFHVVRCLLLSLVAALAACTEAPLPRGVLAMVDGYPIYLRTVETLLDSRTAGLGAFEKPSLPSLRQQYGASLTTLIAHVLVMQELDRQGFPVSEAVVQGVESLIRQDYADDEFDRHLTDNAIDLEAWRELMRYRIAMNMFVTQMLRPGVTVSLEEAEAYYAAHQEHFAVPRMLLLYQIIASDKALLEKVRKEGHIPDDSAVMSVYRLSMGHAALPAEWAKALLGVGLGQTTPIMAVNGRYEMIWLSGDAPARTLDMADAYPYIEEILVEEKIDAAFQEWLEHRLAAAHIRVSTHLVDEWRTAASQEK